MQVSKNARCKWRRRGRDDRLYENAIKKAKNKSIETTTLFLNSPSISNGKSCCKKCDGLVAVLGKRSCDTCGFKFRNLNLNFFLGS